MLLTEQLIDAIKANNNGKVPKLLERILLSRPDINVNAADEDGQTPLHVTCGYNNSQAVELLLARPGIDVNAADNDGESPLHYACYINNNQAVALLLAYPGINVNSRTSSGETPIMFSALWCHTETLKMMLQDPRVDLDARNEDGKGLEEMVGVRKGKKTDKKNCLVMIRGERRRRENNHEEQEQESHEDINGQAGQDQEEDRATVRNQYLEKIDKINEEIGEKEQSLEGKLQINKTKMKELNEKQDLEKKTLDKKLKEEKLNLEQRKAKYEQQLADVQRNLTETQQSMAMVQQREIKDIEKMAKKHGAEKANFEEKMAKEDEEGHKQLAKMKEVTKQLASDLGKLDMDPDNDASSNDHENMEAARETLECPICTEVMRPPTRIWMCSSSHIICESCKDKIEGKLCPTCRTERVTMRAFIVEKIARTIFNR